MKVAVSGANGFVGRALLDRLIQKRLLVQAFVRRVDALRIGSVDMNITSLLDRSTWHDALRQCSVVIHCAGRAHITKGLGKDALDQFRKVNTELTLELARSAVCAGVKRFVFVSSIGVNGLISRQKPFTPEDSVNPETPYAISKYEAEQGLQAISRETGLEVVVVRPPLVYGADAPGNFGSLVALLRRGWPLPFAAVTRNRRSYVALPNLVDLLLKVSDHPNAANHVFLVSDGEDLSTADLLLRLGKALGCPARLLPVPVGILKWGAMLVRREDLYQRLCESLRVDISKTRQLLGWTPPLTVDEGLHRVATSLSAAQSSA